MAALFHTEGIQETENQQKTASFEAALGGYPSRETLSTSFGGSTCAESDLSSIASVSNSQNIVKGVDVARFAAAEPWIASQVPYSSTPTPHPSYHLLFIVLLSIIVLIPPAYVLGTKSFGPPLGTVSPLSEASSVPPAPPSAEPTSQPAVTTNVYSPSDYVSLSQKYFADAQNLSHIRQQTQEDKKEIIGKLQQAIDTISEGINTYPNKSELWIQRASIYTAIQGITPQAEKAAIRDLQQAEYLSKHSSPSQPSLPTGLDLVKEQQALSRNVIVASPDQATSPYAVNTDSSAFSATATIPAGQTSLTIKNSRVSDTGPIYVHPKTNTNATLSVTSKIAGQEFTVTLDNAQNTDVPFQYWITK